MSLKDSGCNANEDGPPSQLSIAQSLLEDLLFQLRRRYLRVDKQMTFDFPGYSYAVPNAQHIGEIKKNGRRGPVTPKKDSADSIPDLSWRTQFDGVSDAFDCLVSRTRDQSKYPLFIDGKTFVDGVDLLSKKPRRKKWSQFLSIRSRAKLSRALRIVRAELREMGLRSGGAPVPPDLSAEDEVV